MIEVSPIVLALIAVTLGGLISYVLHLKTQVRWLEIAHRRLLEAKLEKLDIPHGTTVRITFAD